MLARYKHLLFTVGPFVPVLIGYVAYTTLGSSYTREPQLSSSGFDISQLSHKELNQIYFSLPENVVDIARDRTTEPRYSSSYERDEYDGVFVSVVTGIPLFHSSAKYDAGSGWPSFSSPFDSEHIVELPDHAHETRRTEILEVKGNTHLGHVFNDGPPPTGLRYCINGATLKFIPRQEFLQMYPHYHDDDKMHQEL